MLKHSMMIDVRVWSCKRSNQEGAGDSKICEHFHCLSFFKLNYKNTFPLVDYEGSKRVWAVSYFYILKCHELSWVLIFYQSDLTSPRVEDLNVIRPVGVEGVNVFRIVGKVCKSS